MRIFNLKGEDFHMGNAQSKTVKIWLTTAENHGVTGEDGEDLFPGTPHEVSEQFGAFLIAGGRAEEYDPSKHDPKPAKTAEKAK